MAWAPLSMGVGSGAGGREICETVRTSLKAPHRASQQKTIARGCCKNWRASELTLVSLDGSGEDEGKDVTV